MANLIIILGIAIILSSLAALWIMSRKRKAEVVWIDKIRKKQKKRGVK